MDSARGIFKRVKISKEMASTSGQGEEGELLGKGMRRVFFKMVSRKAPSQSFSCHTRRAVTQQKTVTTIKMVYALERQGCTLVLCTDMMLKSDDLQRVFAPFMTLRQMKQILARATGTRKDNWG